MNGRWRAFTFLGGTSTGRTLSRICDVADPNNWRFCDQSESDVPLQTQFKLAGSIGLHSSYKAMQNVFTPGSCPACPGGPAAVRTDASDGRTFVFYLNDSGVYDGSGGILFQRYPPFDQIAFISIGGRASSQEARPGR